MKATIPAWFVCLGFISVADNYWNSRKGCCLPLQLENCLQSATEGHCSPVHATSEAAAITRNSLAFCAAMEEPKDQAKDRESLSKLQQYVGQWRGVGQPQRGSTKGSWVERAGWIWNFENGKVSLQMNSGDAKYFRSARLRPGEQAGEYELAAVTSEGTEITYQGALRQAGLTLVASTPVEPAPARISIRLVAGGDRMVVLYERQTDRDRYSRLAEVGLTRQGSGFGKGTTFVECVVTGGLGTIPVTHEGKTYYVCCTGCRDYFNDNPKEALAEYRARKEAMK